ncbi:MAG: putative aminohydrolase SsnA [Firmicutes bacterium]|nr:putative aminohydrolase SsnA [Bacillota bacterium]
MQEKRTLIIGNARLMTLGENNRYFPCGAIYTEDGIIRDVGENTEIQDKYPNTDFEDMKGLLVIPGNIIGHTHLYSSFARGMGLKDEAPANFVEILERLWWRLDKVLTDEDNYYSAMVALIQCIKYGSTTIIDHHASPGAIDGSLDVLAKAVFESGIRASLCYEVTDRGGEAEALAGIKENIRFLKKCQDYSTSFVKGALGLHASFTVSDKTLEKCLEEAQAVGSPVLHIHVEEDFADRKDSEEKYGVPVISRLQKMGATKLPILAVHCVHLADEEFGILKNEGINVVHNPSSNMNNAVGVANVLKMMDMGINVGLGTDGMTADYFQEMKVLPLLHKIHARDPRTYSFDRLYQTIFLNNRKVCDLFWKNAAMGAIEPGAYADVVGLDYDPPTPMSADNFLGHCLFGMNSSMVDTTIVNGQPLMRNRKLVHLDEERIMARSRELAKKMWERF